ncbi:hypothetical protein ACFVT8_21960 [Lysinibacillus sp. NPDC058147]
MTPSQIKAIGLYTVLLDFVLVGATKEEHVEMLIEDIKELESESVKGVLT